MCLAVPHRIVALCGENEALAVAGRAEVRIRTDLIDSPAVGETVLVHAGFAVERVRNDEREELEGLWDEIRRIGEGAPS